MKILLYLGDRFVVVMCKLRASCQYFINYGSRNCHIPLFSAVMFVPNDCLQCKQLGNQLRKQPVPGSRFGENPEFVKWVKLQKFQFYFHKIYQQWFISGFKNCSDLLLIFFTSAVRRSTLKTEWTRSTWESTVWGQRSLGHYKTVKHVRDISFYMQRVKCSSWTAVISKERHIRNNLPVLFLMTF